MRFVPNRAGARRRLLRTTLWCRHPALSVRQHGRHAAPARLHDAASLGLPAADATALAIPAQWWQGFGDAQLDRLIDEALASHPSLKVAQARLARAQAGADLMQAARGPQLNLGVDATRQLFTANGMVPKPLAGSVNETGTAQFGGNWELDFFGKNRAALDAALGQARAAQADADAARMLLASQVARSYFQLLRLHEQLGVTQRLLAQRTHALSLVQDRVQAGLDTKLVRQSEASLPDARLQLETLQEQSTLARHALAALLGQPGKALAIELPALSAIKPIAATDSLPSDLLSRRADIVAARWRVQAATEDIGVAQAQFYPNLNLNAFAGFSSIGLDRLLNAGSQQWGVGPALRLPIFDGGRLRANLRGKSAELDVAIESYNGAVIEAVREVIDQLASAQAIGRQQTEQRAAQALAESAYEIALQRYQAGLGNYLSVLAAEASELGQRRQSVDLAARALDTQVALIRALGGGYQAEPAAGHARNPTTAPL
jgi:NodT family efflux transporter outer membrane factor (OMF) lipoprotein